MSRPKTPCDHLDPTVLLLRSLFARACAPMLASMVFSCGGDDASGGTTSKRVKPLALSPTCEEARWIPTSGLSLPEEIEYASYRTNARGRSTVHAESGVPCAGANDARLCAAELDRVSVREVEPSVPFLLATERGTVTAFQTLAEKLAFLGEIDTPDEALLIAHHEGYPIDCTASVEGGEGGFTVQALAYDPCGGELLKSYRLFVDAQGKLKKHSEKNFEIQPCSIGRRPPGLMGAAMGHTRHALGRYFAKAAHLEAASVDAFEIMERELAIHGVPRALRDAIRDAADDETRHARDTARLAERFGARAVAPRMRRSALRSLAEVALDNAVEGCVSETYGAYVATVQARLARDPALAPVLAQIAADETRHAALSWQLAAVLEPRLDPSVRARIDARRRRAIAELRLQTG